jgi:hypothetical protein
MTSKWNNIKLGLALGLLAPVITFFAFYFIRYPLLDLVKYIDFVFKQHVLSPLMSLCGIPNLLIFFVFIWRDFYFSARGVLLATFILAVVVFVIKFAS